MNIRYYQKDGRVGVTYTLTLEEHDQVMKEDLIRYSPAKNPFVETIDIGLVPEDVQAAGKARIREFALQACKERHERHLVEQRRVRDEYYRRMKNVNRTLIVHHDGTTLKGRIVNVSSDEYGVIVQLDKPFASKEGCVFDYPRCYAEAASGAHVFDHEGNLSKRLLRDAEEALIDLYKDEMNRRRHGKTVAIVEKLNGDDA